MHRPPRVPASTTLAILRPPPQPQYRLSRRATAQNARLFHDYFVTHLPSSSLHPDSRTAGPGHRLPRDKSIPHASDDTKSDGDGKRRTPATSTVSRDTTVVRIPLKSAKHHFGASCERGTRPYNEDAFQAGTIEVPAFAKRPPASVVGPRSAPAATGAERAGGDPQVFYFGVFDGHGGARCSAFLREELHRYVEEAAASFAIRSSLEKKSESEPDLEPSETAQGDDQSSQDLETGLIEEWRDTVGGYFRRFKPDYFNASSGGQGRLLYPSTILKDKLDDEPFSPPTQEESQEGQEPSVGSVLEYSFLRADLDFVTTQAHTADELSLKDKDKPNSNPHGEEDDFDLSLGRHSHHSTPPAPFLGGSTCSLALISTPTPMPFWHPSTPLSLLTAHVGDTRILLCSVASGAAIPVTTTHHPSSPNEARRLRRYAAAFTTDSFGEERMSGLANTRAFGDVRSKRLGVSAEPEIRLLHLSPAAHSFLVLVSDGVTLALSDQEIVDVVKEAKTPEQAAKDVVGLATELAGAEKGEADNATAMVVRLGGWERRQEGGGGGMGTKEERDWRRREAREGGGGRRT